VPSNFTEKGIKMLIRQERFLLAVLIMLDVGFYAGRGQTVSAADIAERAGLARRGIEPLLQTLSRSGLLVSVRGPKGGYRLGRPRRDIAVADIVKTVSAEESDTEEGPSGDMLRLVALPLWQELDQLAIAKLAGVTLEDLGKRAEAAGFAKPAREPISFSI
jgi:Rrf2 family protein